MPSYEHNKLIEQLSSLNELPSDLKDFATWIKAGSQLKFLRDNARTNELAIFVSGKYSFIHAAVIPNSRLTSLSQDDLLHWDGTPYRSIASYVWGGGSDDVRVERVSDLSGLRTLDGAIQLVFGRTFEGWSGADRTYFEVNQEYTHLTGIHWRPEERSYCRYNANGDIEHVVSVTARTVNMRDIWCVSFIWQPLEEYLIATNSTLIRRFDFTLMRHGSFTKWPDGAENVIKEDDQLIYRQKIIPGVAAYTSGIQLITPRNSRDIVFKTIRGDRHNRKYVDFIAHDWRNDLITKISTDPKATTNYYDAHSNSLPFDLSPAFFNSEVILKYKTDKDKYKVGERDITCRAAWHLKAFDVNVAGQIFAYICYLRNLPYSEQLHWLSFNEMPKANISDRAIVNDFEGKFTTYIDPLREVISILQTWHRADTRWWILKNERLIENVSAPLTKSRDEWAESFMDLAKLIIEGFVTSTIREKLDKLGIKYEKKEQSIALLERLISKDLKPPEKQQLTGLRTVQLIRTKIKGHVYGHEVESLVSDIVSKHETFAKHFKYVCGILTAELKTIASAFA